MIYLSAFADEASSNVCEQIDALLRNNLQYIELRALDGVNVSKLSLDEAQEYAKLFSQKGIKVFSIGSPIGKVDIGVDFEAYKSEVRHICRLAQIFKTDKVRMFSFYNAFDKGEIVFKYLSEMVAIAKEYGVTLYHENEKEIYGDKVDRVVEIFNKTPGLKFVFDPANYLEIGEDILRAYELLHEKTSYFHIKDVISETKELVPAGYGDGRIDELIRRLDGRDAVLSIEPHLAVFVGYSEIDKTEMKNKFKYADNNESFDAAVSALKELLASYGYKYNEEKRGYEK